MYTYKASPSFYDFTTPSDILGNRRRCEQGNKQLQPMGQRQSVCVQRHWAVGSLHVFIRCNNAQILLVRYIHVYKYMTRFVLTTFRQKSWVPFCCMNLPAGFCLQRKLCRKIRRQRISSWPWHAEQHESSIHGTPWLIQITFESFPTVGVCTCTNT